MEILEKTIRVKSFDDPVYVHAIGDIHLGSLTCCEELLKGHIADIKKSVSHRNYRKRKNSYVVLMGDLLDLVSEDDKRWSAETIARKYKIEDLCDWSNILIQAITDILVPVKDRVLLSLSGNHEMSYEKKHHIKVSKRICDNLKTSYGGYDCFFVLKFTDGFKTKKYHCRATHGNGGATTSGGRTNRLLHYMRRAVCDLTLVGHMHGNEKTERVMIKQSGKKLLNVSQQGSLTGCYLNTYSEGVISYGEKAGYKPVLMGHPRIKIIPSSGLTRIDWIG